MDTVRSGEPGLPEVPGVCEGGQYGAGGGPRPRAGAEREGPGEGGRRGGCDRPGDGEGVAGAAVTEGLSKVERGGTAPHPQVRLARAGDDLSAVLGSTDPLAW